MIVMMTMIGRIKNKYEDKVKGKRVCLGKTNKRG